jgi:hypothetical protein
LIRTEYLFQSSSLNSEHLTPPRIPCGSETPKASSYWGASDFIEPSILVELVSQPDHLVSFDSGAVGSKAVGLEFNPVSL